MTVTATEIIQDLRRRGVQLEAVGDRLRFRPREAVTSDLVEALKQHKAEIISTLTAPAVPARVRGLEGMDETVAAEICWHCKGEKVCRCASCAVAGPRMQWAEGRCRACKGTGLLCWPAKVMAGTR